MGMIMEMLQTNTICGVRQSFRMIVLATFGILSALSCQKGIGQTVEQGDDVVFCADAKGSESSTKTDYSGVLYSSDKYERIDWESGDVIRIYSEQTNYNYRDYQVQTGSIAVATGGQSTATIKKIEKVGLRWGEETVDHYFYAVYPRPSSDSVTTSIDVKKVEANLASEQNTRANALSGSTGSNYVLKPDLRWQLMTAFAGPYKPSTFPATGSVVLDFVPLTTAIQFVISNGASSDLSIKKVSLISAGTQIAGRFTVNDMTDFDTDGFPKVTPNTSDASMKTVSISLASAITLQQGKTFTFTFFTMPGQNLSDLSFQLTKSDNSTLTTRLGYTDGTGVTIKRCKKTFIEGLAVPEGVRWTIDFQPSFTPWSEDATHTIYVNE